jgi:hypothetical protein
MKELIYYKKITKIFPVCNFVIFVIRTILNNSPQYPKLQKTQTL